MTKEEAFKQLLNSTREQLQAQQDTKNLTQFVQLLTERVDKLESITRQLLKEQLDINNVIHFGGRVDTLESTVRDVEYSIRNLERIAIEQHGLEEFHKG